MATIHGEGSLDNKNLLVYISLNEKNKNGQYLNVQLDQSLFNPDKVRCGERQADSNPYLYTTTLKNGYVSHLLFYSYDQIEQIKKAADTKKVPVEGKYDVVGYVYGINASLCVRDNGFAIDTTKQMIKTRNPWFGRRTMEKQSIVTKAAKDWRWRDRGCGLIEKNVEKSKDDDGLSL